MEKNLKARPIHLIISFGLVSSIVFLLGAEYYKAVNTDLERHGALLEEDYSGMLQYNVPLKHEVQKRLEVQSVLAENDRYLGHNVEALAKFIIEKSKQYGMDPFLVLAVIKTESNFQSYAISNKGAVGLMQIKPSTASIIADEISYPYSGSHSLKNGKINIMLGMHYIAKMMEKFNDIELALEAYNMGPSRLRKNLRKGTKLGFRYSKKVITNYYRYLEDHYYNTLYDFADL
ncbi:MAG: lytic transglycosylase domain-containing protein [Nitrospinota bacterium]